MHDSSMHQTLHSPASSKPEAVCVPFFLGAMLSWRVEDSLEEGRGGGVRYDVWRTSRLQLLLVFDAA
jgi:hypothetical protein